MTKKITLYYHLIKNFIQYMNNVNKIVVLQHKFINSQTIINDLNNKRLLTHYT